MVGKFTNVAKEELGKVTDEQLYDKACSLEGMGKYEQAFAILKMLEGKGNAKVEFHLANNYFSGIGTERNIEESFEHYKTAAELGLPVAYYWLGRCYYYGEGTNPNYEAALGSFRLAYDNGVQKAAFYIAKCYEQGLGTQPSEREAFLWMTKASADYPAGIGGLAAYYFNGYGCEQNVNKAFELQCRAAKCRIPNSQQCDPEQIGILSRFYENGWGTEPDDDKAWELLEQAANGGDGYALFRFGVNYYNHECNKEAFDLFNQAANAGYTDAVLYLGECYFYGRGTAVNYELAAQCYNDAYHRRCMTARCPLAECYLNGWGVEKDEQYGRKLLAQARIDGDEEAKHLFHIYFEKKPDVDAEWINQTISMEVSWWADL